MRKGRVGQVSMNVIIMLCCGFFLTALLMPMVLNQIHSPDMSAWSPAVKTIYTVVIPIIMILAVAISYIPGGKRQRQE